MGIASDAREEKTKFYNEAIRIYNKCNIENENSAITYFKLGEVCDSKEDKMKCYNDAIRIYNKCNIENENSAITYFKLGEVLRFKRR